MTWYLLWRVAAATSFGHVARREGMPLWVAVLLVVVVNLLLSALFR